MSECKSHDRKLRVCNSQASNRPIRRYKLPLKSQKHTRRVDQTKIETGKKSKTDSRNKFIKNTHAPSSKGKKLAPERPRLFINRNKNKNKDKQVKDKGKGNSSVSLLYCVIRY